jgi:hypothetical protein
MMIIFRNHENPEWIERLALVSVTDNDLKDVHGLGDPILNWDTINGCCVMKIGKHALI